MILSRFGSFGAIRAYFFIPSCDLDDLRRFFKRFWRMRSEEEKEVEGRRPLIGRKAERGVASRLSKPRPPKKNTIGSCQRQTFLWTSHGSEKKNGLVLQDGWWKQATVSTRGGATCP